MGFRLTAFAPGQAGAVDVALSKLVEIVRRAHDELSALVSRDGTAAEIDVLAEWLYLHWYSRPMPNRICTPTLPGRANLVPALRAALAATGRWETGWVALQVLPDNSCMAGRGQLTRVVASGDYANVARPGVPLAPGDGLAVLDRLEWVDEPTGFWGCRSLEAEPSHPLTRIYWSVGWECIGKVLCGLMPMLDATRRPWSLKCPSQAVEFARVDSLVVYLAQADWPVFEPQVRACAVSLAAYLHEAVPPLTLPITRGVALADSPSLTQSFGQSRCAALAEGVRTLLTHRCIESSEAIELLKQSLRNRAIDPAKPWVCD